MITLSDDQETDLEHATATLFACVELARKTGQTERSFLVAKDAAWTHVIGTTPCWSGFSNSSPLRLKVAMQAFYSEAELGNSDRHSALEGSYEHVLSNLRHYITAPGETGVLLANMLGLEAGQPWPQLRNLVDAGVLVEELCELDPNFFIVTPGVEALYKKWGPWLDATHADVGEVLSAIKSTIGRVFVAQ
jgi:hypothetical protein